MSSNIDLHIHTVYSDGTDTPEVLINTLKIYNIDTFAICDHDTVDGCKVLSTIDLHGMNFLCGVEFSCITEFKKCHILGLGIDIYNQHISEVINEAAKLRTDKLHYRLNYLKENYNIVFSDDDVFELTKFNSVGKPHIAHLLIKYGYAENIDTAISNYLKLPVKNDRVDAKTAIAAIKAAGGVPIWAHPLGGEGEHRLTEEFFYKQLYILIDAGICGLECYYSRYDSVDINFLLSAADKCQLYISGGSDYHGKNKKISPGQLSSEDLYIKKEDLTVLNEVI